MKKYVTTTLPYINSRPHIGHALEFIQADAIARHLRSKTWSRDGHDVTFNVGVDEHGSKVHAQAQAMGVDTKRFCDEQSSAWTKFCELFDITYTSFYRTSTASHAVKARAFWNECVERGDIYKDTYSGMYCVGCESRKLDKDLVDGKCPDHGVAPEQLDEVNWFFRLTKYRPQLEELVRTEGFLLPQYKQAELLNLVADSEDISISRDRSAVPWGVPVPGDDTQTMYVWFEALLNYIFAINPHYPDVSFAESRTFNETWTDAVQLCGPDNIRFQGCIFQAFLISAGIKPTSRLLVHGTVMGPDGTKMSKTKGNVIDPIDQLEKYGLDAVRYYALAGIDTFNNSSWIESDLVNKANSFLADSFGNLFTRTFHLREIRGYAAVDGHDQDFAELRVNQHILKADWLWESLCPKAALEEAQALVSFGNQYMNEREPWKNPDTAEQTLNNLRYLLSAVIDMIEPAVPGICAKAREAMRRTRRLYCSRG